MRAMGTVGKGNCWFPKKKAIKYPKTPTIARAAIALRKATALGKYSERRRSNKTGLKIQIK